MSRIFTALFVLLLPLLGALPARASLPIDRLAVSWRDRNSIQTANRSTSAHLLPRSIANTVQRTFQRDYQNRVTNVQITQAERMTWHDCLPDLPNGRFSHQPCAAVTRSGWRVTVTGDSDQQRITRVYGAVGGRQRAAVMDTVRSLTEAQRSQVAAAVHLPISQLQIAAVQEEAFLPATACPARGPCPIPPLALSWRVLEGTTDRIVHVSSLGAPIHTEASTAFFSEGDRPLLGTLPLEWANAVMRDARERLATAEFLSDSDPSAGAEVELRLDAVEAIEWNECAGAPGPSRPARGICPDIPVSGWRMTVLGGLKQDPFRWVYYIPTDVDRSAFVPTPDGLQSLPPAVRTRILQAAAAQADLPVDRLSLRWATARLFDRCLGTQPAAASCRSEIRPGWQVELLVASPIATNGGQPLWVYHTNLTGTDVRLASQGFWAPPP